MPIINVTLPSDATTADVADYNVPIQTMLAIINGLLDDANIASMNGSKLVAGSVPVTALPAADYANLVSDELYSNAMINGGCIIAQRVTAPALSTTYQYGAVDRFAAKGTGTAVSAGTIGQTATPNATLVGFALKLIGVTITGTGIVYARYRMEARDALRFKNLAASVSLKVYHDVGSAVNYTIYINKPTVADNFTSVTAIANSGAISVPTGAATTIKLENINTGNLGDVSNGLEIEVQAACGAITTKNFEYTEWEFNLGSKIKTFQPRSFDRELSSCMRYYEKTKSYPVAPSATDGLTNGGTMTNTERMTIWNTPSGTGTRAWGSEPFKVLKRVAPTIRYWDGAAGLSLMAIAGTNLGTVFTGQNETFRGVTGFANGIQYQIAPASNYWCLLSYDADAEL